MIWWAGLAIFATYIVSIYYHKQGPKMNTIYLQRIKKLEFASKHYNTPANGKPYETLSITCTDDKGCQTDITIFMDKPLPATRANGIPLYVPCCTGCDKPGVDTIKDGNAWHNDCLAQYRAEMLEWENELKFTAIERD